jgi:hypothetical protein
MQRRWSEGWTAVRPAAIQGGLVLTQTRRDSQQLRVALDAAYAYLRSFAAWLPRAVSSRRDLRILVER